MINFTFDDYENIDLDDDIILDNDDDDDDDEKQKSCCSGCDNCLT